MMHIDQAQVQLRASRCCRLTLQEGRLPRLEAILLLLGQSLWTSLTPQWGGCWELCQSPPWQSRP